jgi:CO/xanthine dehydrogenase FAD-binding subunit
LISKGRCALQDFDYVQAQSVNEVVTLLRGEKPARILAGGTDLIVQLREGRRSTRMVIDIKRVPEACEFAYNAQDGLTIGAAVPCWKIAGDPAIAAAYPGLVDAVSLIGGVQIQGRATVGGNLCNASPAADSIPALIVHRAVCRIAGPDGERDLPVEDFCTAPGQTVMQPGEFLVGLRIPPPPAGFGARYLRFIPRNEMDIAVVGVGAAVVLSEDQSTFSSVRVALGAVAPIPLFVREVGEFLNGKAVSAENIFAAAQLAQSAARPINDMRGTAEQRRHLSLILAKRALTGAVERARGLASGSGGNGHQR